MKMRAAVTGLALVAVALAILAGPVHGADPPELPAQDWSFSGPFGTFDQAALRRGLEVYLDACASCHGIRHVAYRNLSALGVGYGPEDIKAFAAEFEVQDGPDETGKLFWRPARPSDRFAPPYPNAQAARAANKGMFPPDLSLITRARAGGADFLYAFLVGYEDAPEHLSLGPGMYHNRFAPGGQTGMAPQLFEELIEYEDGTPATVEQMAADVTTFLAWTADPHMEARKSMGLRVVAFLALLTIMFIALKREVWAQFDEPPPATEGDRV